MKKFLVLTALMFAGSALHAFPVENPCASFIPQELMNKIPHLERNGVCFIERNDYVNDLIFDREKTLKKLEKFDPSVQLVPLFIGNTSAYLVDSDMLYAMEDGNEQAWRPEQVPQWAQAAEQANQQTQQVVTQAQQATAPYVAPVTGGAVGGAIAGIPGGPAGVAAGAVGGAVGAAVTTAITNNNDKK